jgi:hypothetical protein
LTTTLVTLRRLPALLSSPMLSTEHMLDSVDSSLALLTHLADVVSMTPYGEDENLVLLLDREC